MVRTNQQRIEACRITESEHSTRVGGNCHSDRPTARHTASVNENIVNVKRATDPAKPVAKSTADI